MAEYYDFGTNYTQMLGTLDDNKYTLTGFIKSLFGYKDEPILPEPAPTVKKSVDPQFIKVRESICVVGLDWSAIQHVKDQIASLADRPLPLESLHVKQESDFRDGALLVPKVVLVARHRAGQKLIDDDGDQGQLDHIYDEICDIGADVLVVYLGLPRSVYPPTRHMVYHPRMAQLLFPTQPTLRSLAETYSLITITETASLTSMQKNVMREWLSRPVGDDHPVYNKAHQMLEFSFSEAEFLSETELYRYKKPVPYHAKTRYLSATEEHVTPEDEERRKKKKKKVKKTKGSGQVGSGQVGVLIDLDQDNLELEMYNGEALETDELLVGSFTV